MMKNNAHIATIDDPAKIAAQIDSLADRSEKGNLMVKGSDEVIKVVFRGHSEKGPGAHVLTERHHTLFAHERIDAGKDVELTWIADGGVFSFDSYVMDEEGKDGLIKLKFPEKTALIQKRGAFRVSPPVTPPFHAFINTTNEELEFLVEDISSGGMALLINLGKDILYEGIKFPELRFTLPNGHTVKTAAILRYIFPTDYKEAAKKNRCGVMFLDMREKDKEEVTRYIFARQRDELKTRS